MDCFSPISTISHVLDRGVSIGHFANHCSCSSAIAEGAIDGQLVIQVLASCDVVVHAANKDMNLINRGPVSIARDVSCNAKLICGSHLLLVDLLDASVRLSGRNQIG